jgi:hypothetical protein
MRLPAVLPEGFLKALPAEERKKLGRAGITSEEAQARYVAGQEKKVQRDIATWLNRERIYFESDRIDRKTSGKKGALTSRLRRGPVAFSRSEKRDWENHKRTSRRSRTS